MGCIYYILGKSGAGKDTIYCELLKRRPSLMKVVPYTTRPMRNGESEGVQYRFRSEEEFQQLLAEGKIIEDRCYNTVHGPWRYFTVADEQLLAEGDILMIGVLESYISVRDYFGSEKVKPLYIEVEDGLRLERALLREKQQKEPKYKEMCRRFLADSEDFSEEKLISAGITDKIINDNIDHCIEQCFHRMGAAV